MPVCRTCLQDLNVDEFYTNKACYSGRLYHCKNCHRRYVREQEARRKLHPPPHAGACCFICREPDKRLCLDHCHASGRVRGWLCYRCNVYCDRMGTPELMLRAYEYIKDPPGLAASPAVSSF